MSKVVEDAEIRKTLAVAYAPIVYQEYNSVFDLIGPVELDKVDDVVKNFARIGSNPCLNYGVRSDDKNWYIYYMVYHPFDISNHPIRFVRKADSHRHDTESILFRVNKLRSDIDVITVCHYLFQCERNTDAKVVIEADGHGIRPYSLGEPKGNFIKYSIFEFVDLNAMSPTEWEAMRAGFAGQAAMPDEQYDSILQGSSSGRLHNKKGDIWNRPEVLFETMELIRRL